MTSTPAQPQSQPPHGINSSAFWLRAALILLILLGIFLTAFFGARTIRSYGMLRLRHHPPLTDVTMIRNWMTIPYIARAFRVPEPLLWQGLGIPEPLNRHQSLRALDVEYGHNQPDYVLNKLREIIRAYQAEHPTPAIPTPPPGEPGL